MNKIRVLIVDDSLFMRKVISNMLKDEPDIEVIGLAHNGREALDMIGELNPDVVTLDVEMPVMDGLTALERIMKEKPVPVLMVSSLTKDGAEATLKALELGAVDFMPKNPNSMGFFNVDFGLKEKIRRFSKNKPMMKLLISFGGNKTSGTKLVKPAAGSRSTGKYSSDYSRNPKKIVAIGVSTGGPQSLHKIIPMLPGNLGVPVVITQHMPPGFTESLAQRLNAVSPLTVVEAKDKEKLHPNVVYIAKGGIHMKFKKDGNSVITDFSLEPSDCFNRPSVDVMVSSLADIYGRQCLGVIMTGMGADGVKGLAKLKSKSGIVIAQDESSSIIFGMPKAVIEKGLADEITPLEKIPERIIYYCN